MTSFTDDLALLRRLNPPTVAQPDVVEPLVRRGWVLTFENPRVLLNAVWVTLTPQGKAMLRETSREQATP